MQRVVGGTRHRFAVAVRGAAAATAAAATAARWVLAGTLDEADARVDGRDDVAEFERREGAGLQLGDVSWGRRARERGLEGRRGRVVAAVVRRVGVRRCVLLECEAALFEGVGDLASTAERHEDVVGEIRCYEEDGAFFRSVRNEHRGAVRSDQAKNEWTYIPANARGLVSSRTRCPASRPSPSTCITM